MREIRYRDALREAMTEEMQRDGRVVIISEEAGHYQSAHKLAQGLLERFGECRVVDSPIAEAGFAGLAIGAAMLGLRPIVEFMTWNSSFVAFDQIVNNAAKMQQMITGQYRVPVVFQGFFVAKSVHSNATQQEYVIWNTYRYQANRDASHGELHRRGQTGAWPRTRWWSRNMRGTALKMIVGSTWIYAGIRS